jgi:hypothetical protein
MADAAKGGSGGLKVNPHGIRAVADFPRFGVANDKVAI